MSAAMKRPATKKRHRSSSRNLHVPAKPTRTPLLDVVDSQRYDPKLAGQFLGVSPGTLSIWRCTKRYNLPFVKVGSKVQYFGRDLREFIESRRVVSDKRKEAQP